MCELEDLCCMNSECEMFGIRGAENLSWHGWSGNPENGIRRFRCRSCGKTHSERKGTALWQSRLPEDKLVEVLEHVAEGNGVRATHRLTGVHRDTISRLTRVAGEHAAALHDELVAFPPSHRGGRV